MSNRKQFHPFAAVADKLAEMSPKELEKLASKAEIARSTITRIKRRENVQLSSALTVARKLGFTVTVEPRVAKAKKIGFAGYI